MMPQLGVLSAVDTPEITESARRAAVEVFKKDCLIHLGTCLAPVGPGKPGQARASRSRSSSPAARRSASPSPTATPRSSPSPGRATPSQAVLKPARGFDMGGGPGQARSRPASRAASSGVIVDCRGRQPFVIPEDTAERVAVAPALDEGAGRLPRPGRLTMGHAYTPGLSVAEFTLLRKERKLPLLGEVLVKPGDRGRARPGRRPHEPPGRRPVGERRQPPLHRGRRPSPSSCGRRRATPSRRARSIAESKSFFGLFKTHCESPITGTIETLSTVTGQVLLREPPIPVEVQGLRGRGRRGRPREGRGHDRDLGHLHPGHLRRGRRDERHHPRGGGRPDPGPHRRSGSPPARRARSWSAGARLTMEAIERAKAAGARG